MWWWWKEYKKLNLFFFLTLKLISWAPYTILHWLIGESSKDLEKNRGSLIGIGDLFSMSLSTSKAAQNKWEKSPEKARLWLSWVVAGYPLQVSLSLSQKSLTFTAACACGMTMLILKCFPSTESYLIWPRQLAQPNELREQCQCWDTHHKCLLRHYRDPLIRSQQLVSLITKKKKKAPI